jgi:hypothetical protein
VPYPGLELLDFYSVVAEAFGLPSGLSTSEDFVEQFARFLEGARARTERVLLVVDEAHHLRLELFAGIERLLKADAHASLGGDGVAGLAVPRKAQQLEPDSVDVRLILGTILSSGAGRASPRGGRFQATEAYRKSIAFAPRDAKGWAGFGSGANTGRGAGERAGDPGGELPGGRRGSFVVFASDCLEAVRARARLTLTATLTKARRRR